MFERFGQAFTIDSERAESLPPLVEYPNRGFRELLTAYSGCSFCRGLYRIVNGETVLLANQLVGALSAAHAGKVCSFAFDWQGNVFAVDPYSEGASVLLFEPGTGEVLSPDMDILKFHNSFLPEDPTGALGSRFQAWLESGGPPLRYTQCLGYRVPLFLGGQDSVDNLEVSSIHVYWDISGQLVEKTRDVPPGTPIDNVTIGP